MIMEKFRGGKFIKLIMGGVILAFLSTIFFSWGMGASDKKAQNKVVIEVGDRKVTISEFGKLLDNQIRMMKNQSGLYPTPFEINKLKNELAEGLVYKYLRDKSIEELGLSASPVEILDYMKINAPEGIKRNETFLTNGVFDTSKYYGFIESAEAFDNLDLVRWEHQLRTNEIPNTKLQSLIALSGKPNRLELKDQIKRKAEKADIEYAFISLTKIKLENNKAKELDADIYYKANKDSFKIEESTELEYITIPKVAGLDDSKEALSQITEIYKKALAGEDFADLAKMYSDDEANSEKGGSLGNISKGSMVKEFEDVAWTLTENQISKPVKTMFGYHIIKLNSIDLAQNQRNLQHVLIKVRIGIGTQEELRTKAEKLKSKILGKAKMVELAKKNSFQYKKTGLFSSAEEITGFSTKDSYIPELKNFALDSDNPEKIKVLDNQDAFYVFKIAQKVTAGYVPFKDAKKDILVILNNKRKIEKAKETIAKLKSKLKDSQSILDLKSTEANVEFGDKKSISRLDYIPFLGVSSKAVFAAFAKEGKVVGPFKVAGGAVIAKATNVVKVNDAEVEKQVTEMMAYYGYQLQNKTVNEWYTYLREKSAAKIDLVDLRN